MHKMLEELFCGNITPNEKQPIQNIDYDRTMRTLSESEDMMIAWLDGKETSLLLYFFYAQRLVTVQLQWRAL